MNLKKEMSIAINNAIPCEIINAATTVAEKHIEMERLLAIQEYLLEHGANDEIINDKIRELKNLNSK